MTTEKLDEQGRSAGTMALFVGDHGQTNVIVAVSQQDLVFVDWFEAQMIIRIIWHRDKLKNCFHNDWGRTVLESELI